MGKKNGDEFYRFIVDEPGKCELCRFYSICTGKYKDKKKRKEFKIAKNIVENYELIDRHKEKLHSAEGKMIYSRRMPIIEKVFGFLKGKLKFYQFSRKGFNKVRLEWSLGCMAYNLRRMFTLENQRA